MLSDQEKEDIEKRKKKIEAGKRYQQELDAQLTELRTRSFNALASKQKSSKYFCLCFFEYLFLYFNGSVTLLFFLLTVHFFLVLFVQRQ